MKKNRIHILCDRYVNFDTGKLTIGGIQTYVTDLSKVASSMGFEVYIYDFDNQKRKIVLDFCTIIGLNYPDTKKGCDKMAQYVFDNMPSKEDLVIYDSDDRISLTPLFNNAISLQHGITWDMPNNKRRSLIRTLMGCTLRDYRILRRVTKVGMLVCVDCNFVNWYRTFIRNNRVNMRFIPNYTRISSTITKPDDTINIIFARRLFKYRGTSIFTNAIKRILGEYTNVKIFIYGNGPEEAWMHSQLDLYSNVFFDNYATGESLLVHADKHIAIVPTIGSEGTSLSLLEAMSSQCAVVCSDVGGMTNIVLDGFNGKMVPASNVEALYKAVKYLIDNPEERERMANNGYETVKQAFSFERWKKEWETILMEYIK